MIDIREFQILNAQRAKRWHGDSAEAQWSVLEWCGTMAGEVGEACNAAKKLKRITDQMANNDGRLFGQVTSLEEQHLHYELQVGKEAADAIIYGLLVFNKLGIDAESVIRDVFNKKSEEYGFPEKV